MPKLITTLPSVEDDRDDPTVPPELKEYVVFPWNNVSTRPTTFSLCAFVAAFLLLFLPLQSGESNPPRFVAQFSAAQLALLAISVRFEMLVSFNYFFI